MILDYNASRDIYVLRVPATMSARPFMREHGWDYSSTASDGQWHVLFNRDDYAAATFAEFATDDALLHLAPILAEIEASERLESGAHIASPPDRELWPFQKANIEYALRRTNTLIGDEPGLGKTPQAICYSNEIRGRKNLVVCPASIRYQWMQRIQEWQTTAWQGELKIHITRKSADGIYPTDTDDVVWQIVSYDLTRSAGIHAALMRNQYDLLVLDEPHYLKETDTKRTQAVFGTRQHPGVADRAAHILGLTGTPLPNRPREAYTLARGLCWDAIDWMSEDRFRKRYNPSMTKEVTKRNGEVVKVVDERTGRHSELQNRLRANFMCRHLKHGPRGAMPQLKMPIYDLIQLEETAAVKQALAAESLLDINPESLEGADMETMGHISVVRRQMGLALAPQIADYMEMLIAGGEEKLTLFAWHIEVLDILQRRLAKYGLVRIDGRTGPKMKYSLVQEFVNNPKIHLCVGNTLSMGTGTDGLQQVCNHGLIAEPDWVAGNNIQCFDRLDRGGQTWQIQGDIFVAPGSIAEKILAAALRKNQTTHKALDAKWGE